MRLLRCPPTCLRCGSFVASVLSNFEMSDSLCIWILMFSCLFHGQVFVIPTGVDAAMEAIQFALLACSSYDWASLERGFIVLQESLCRYHRRHASPTACMLSTSMTLLRRQRPWHMDDEEIALSVQRFLDAVSATLPHRFLGDEIVVFFFPVEQIWVHIFGFFCVSVCVEKHCFCTSGQKQCKVKLGSHWIIRLDTWMSWIHLLFGRRTHPSVRPLHHLQAESFQSFGSKPYLSFSVLVPCTQQEYLS